MIYYFSIRCGPVHCLASLLPSKKITVYQLNEDTDIVNTYYPSVILMFLDILLLTGLIIIIYSFIEKLSNATQAKCKCKK